MGHHLFARAGKTFAVRDADLRLLRVALEEGARRTNQSSVESALRSWEHQAPGVWLNVKEAVLAGQAAVFDSAIEWALGFGEAIPLAYLNQAAAIPGGYWTDGQKTDRIVGLLRDLKQFFADSA